MPADGRLPAAIGGVSVLLGGRVAHSSFVRGDQINFLVPPDLPAGWSRLDVTTPQGRASQVVEVVDFAPAFYVTMRDGRRFAAPRPVHAGDDVGL